MLYNPEAVSLQNATSLDLITEKTLDAGVTIESVVIKDGVVAAPNGSTGLFTGTFVGDLTGNIASTASTIGTLSSTTATISTINGGLITGSIVTSGSAAGISAMTNGVLSSSHATEVSGIERSNRGDTYISKTNGFINNRFRTLITCNAADFSEVTPPSGPTNWIATYDIDMPTGDVAFISAMVYDQSAWTALSGATTFTQSYRVYAANDTIVVILNADPTGWTFGFQVMVDHKYQDNV